LAEQYFASLDDKTHHLAKPFGTPDETPQLLINFATALQGLSVCPGMTVLEFGAGTCWASHGLAQLGCSVIAADVSATALRVGEELFARHPLFGERPAPRFMIFDGHRLDLPDQSVDRIIYAIFNRFNEAAANPFFDVVNTFHQRAGSGRYYSQPTAAFDPRQFQFGFKFNF